MSDYFTELFREKRWLLWGSLIGGIVGALLMYLNEMMPVHEAITLGMPPGLGYAVILGMIGGLVGGAIGSFIAGRLAHEDVVIGLGESLGVGLVNGFLAGTLAGLVMGLLR